MGRVRALEVLLSTEDYDAELAECYGWINRALPAAVLGDFVKSLAHSITSFPVASHAVVKDRVNAMGLASGRGVPPRLRPLRRRRAQPRVSKPNPSGYEARLPDPGGEMALGGCWAI